MFWVFILYKKKKTFHVYKLHALSLIEKSILLYASDNYQKDFNAPN